MVRLVLDKIHGSSSPVAKQVEGRRVQIADYIKGALSEAETPFQSRNAPSRQHSDNAVLCNRLQGPPRHHPDLMQDKQRRTHSAQPHRAARFQADVQAEMWGTKTKRQGLIPTTVGAKIAACCQAKPSGCAPRSPDSSGPPRERHLDIRERGLRSEPVPSVPMFSLIKDPRFRNLREAYR